MTTAVAGARAEAVAAAMDDIRRIEAELGVTRHGVEAIRRRLLDLTAARHLFPPDDFPPPRPDDRDDPGPASVLHRLAQDPDDRFALYAQVSAGMVWTPVHDHGTWAVVVGFEGQELNRFYRRLGEADTDGVTPTGQHVVRAGTGVAMLPDDLHSIHIDGPALNFHCYGLALERLDRRRYYNEHEGRWKPFGNVSTIVEARPGLATG